MPGESPRSSKVFLVGAGPGAPGLITRRGWDCLSVADAVVYDHLANPALLAATPVRAKRVYVGKQANHHTFNQAEINDLLIDLAHQYDAVVRLKGGDPIIFGRGAEEAEALRAAGIRFEIVPGVTAASAVAAYAGIPLTHRNWSSSVALITGHGVGGVNSPNLNWPSLAKGTDTLCFYMGLTRLTEITTKLIQHGRSPDTPVAVVQWGTLPAQRVITGTLSDISGRVSEAALTPPVMVFVGPTVALADRLDWWQPGPLAGQRVVVTRSEETGSDFEQLLHAAGAQTILFPCIALAPPDDNREVEQAIRSIEEFDWVVLTSTQGVKFFFDGLDQLGLDARALHACRVAVIGPATAEALKSHGVKPDLIAPEAVAESLLEILAKETSLAGKRFLLPQGDLARPTLREGLQALGAGVSSPVLYANTCPRTDTTPLREQLEAGGVEWVTFTSSSCVTNFFNLFQAKPGDPLFEGVRWASIGPVTSRTLLGRGVTPHAEANPHTLSGLVEAIMAQA